MKISVALCTYNGENFLEKQLDSILNQTVPVNEIVVCDDCSKDNTISILEKYSVKYPNLFKIYKNEQNLRSNKNFEKAIKLTSGDYIFLSDQDDIWKTNKVESILNVFEENPKAEGVFSDADLIDDTDKPLFNNTISLWDSVYFFEKKIPRPVDLYKILVLKGNFLTGATLCIKKDVKEFCFPFQTIENIFLHDEWFAFVLTQRKTLYYSTNKLISYRIHSNQQMGVGNIISNHKKIKKDSSILDLTLGIRKPKSFKDYKTISRALFIQYEKYKLLSENNEALNKLTSDLLEAYLAADQKMKETNPILYFFRKRKDRKKGKRQL
jgi:glycosyltransferase involved in cell wall biosynthesis